MELPKPITTLEALLQLKYYCWKAVADMFTLWQRPYDQHIRVWAEALDERALVVGRQQALRDYCG